MANCGASARRHLPSTANTLNATRRWSVGFSRSPSAKPTADDTVEILNRGYVTRFEEKHDVTILPEALQTAVLLSVRFMRERRLPDKAVDVLDDACARVAVPMLSAQPGDKAQAAVVTADVSRLLGGRGEDRHSSGTVR